mmetsp:Transcript_74732/g.222849  ORF Transcript_74732/g.222849 Transcript_74732/m.222849 type:complete len:489 (+) Transcript_74732:87-1553(+)
MMLPSLPIAAWDQAGPVLPPTVARVPPASVKSGRRVADAAPHAGLVLAALVAAKSAWRQQHGPFRRCGRRPPTTQLRATAQADPESLRWALELALRAENYEEAARLRKALPTAEVECPVTALDSLVRDRVQRALGEGLDSSMTTMARLEAVRRLQVLATPPGATEEAEDALHQILSSSDDPDVVELTEAALWAVWLPSGDEAVDITMREGLRLMGAGDLTEAVKAFTQVVDAAPSYAEGWNKRATALFLAERFDESIEDCRRVLELKPRHFGCLSGLGICHLRKGNETAAARWLRKAIDVNPRSGDMQRIVFELEARTVSAILQPRIQKVLEAMKAGRSAGPRTDIPLGILAQVQADWDAFRVQEAGKYVYYFRVRVRCLGGEPVSGVARYYALQGGDSVLPLSRMTQGSAGFSVGPGESYQYSFMLSFSKELSAAEGGLLLRCREELFEVGLGRLFMQDAPVVEECELDEMNAGYRFMGRLEIHIGD